MTILKLKRLKKMNQKLRKYLLQLNNQFMNSQLQQSNLFMKKYPILPSSHFMKIQFNQYLIQLNSLCMRKFHIQRSNLCMRKYLTLPRDQFMKKYHTLQSSQSMRKYLSLLRLLFMKLSLIHI